MVAKKNIKSLIPVKRLSRSRWFWTLKNAVKDVLHPAPLSYPIADDRQDLEVAQPVLLPWPDDLPRPKVGLVQERENPPYWTKYERFLRNNDFPFEYYDVHSSGWRAASDRFEVILWALERVALIEEHKRKTYLLENQCGKACFPSFDTLMWNEDKIFQYEWLRMKGFPVVETFISYDYQETLETIPHLTYPLVNKSPAGAGSLGVELIKDAAQARKIARQAFSPVGRPTYWPFIRQKDFVYFQKFQPNQGYDLRIIVVGKRAFGYYRDLPKGEFRASGMGLVRKGELPREAVLLAKQLVEQLDLVIAAVDMLCDPDGRLHVIEMSPNIQVDTAGQLHVDDVPGAYVFDEIGTFHFEPCKVWIQELALYEFFTRWLKVHAHTGSKIVEGASV